MSYQANTKCWYFIHFSATDLKKKKKNNSKA